MWQIVVDPLFPRFCLSCRERLPARGAALDLCRRCSGRLVALDAERSCRGCARPLPRSSLPQPTCGACLREPPPWRRLHALWAYQQPLDGVIGGLKFRGLDYLGARLAACAIRERAGVLAGIGGVVPVPLPWLRRLRRGYNQAERIARPLARGLGVEFLPALARAGLLPAPQVGQGRAQRLRLARAGSMRLRGSSARVAGRTLLLVDDVLTTGATARAATAALRAAGAEAVEILVVGATPPARAAEGAS